MQPIKFFAIVLVLVLGVCTIAVADQTSPYLPDPQLTPGSVFADVSQQEICQPGYTKSVRAVSSEEKQQVYREYGISNRRPREYTIDHLIPLELGGSNEIRNLWPEPNQGPNNAHDKDELENVLHEQVCAGNIPLEQAQQEIQSNWTSAYQQYVARQ
ncbi:MAG: HNH endonuclease [Chroococcidiopsidaceae cyanobacterium CP_BM_ER_R8_30]|nr:HNH endonuclease [Chroococcidiopsidaceae cyanobacterium CP_BM_ER_R8_30]